MSKLLQEVTAVVGKYKGQDGKEKNRYQRISRPLRPHRVLVNISKGRSNI